MGYKWTPCPDTGKLAFNRSGVLTNNYNYMMIYDDFGMIVYGRGDDVRKFIAKIREEYGEHEWQSPVKQGNWLVIEGPIS